MKKSIVLVGGFCEMTELCEEIGYNEILIVDKKYYDSYHKYIGNDETLIEDIIKYSDLDFCLSPDQPNARWSIYKKYNNYKLNFPIIKSNYSKISNYVEIDIGVVIQYGSFISNNVKLGKFVKLNVNSCIMHDCIVGDFCTLSPSCTLLGNVKLGSNCYIGSSATILPGIKICDNVTVGAGTVVTKDISCEGVYIGNPARFLR